MIKISNINKNFFKKTMLSMGLISGTILASSIAYRISDSQYLFITAKVKNSREHNCICNYEPYGIDRIIWDDNYINEEIEVYHTNYLDSNIIKARVFRGTSKSTHYRIEYVGKNLGDCNVLEWKVLPENNIIVFNIEDIPKQKRYDKYISVEFGTYNSELDIIEKDNSRFVAMTASSQEILKEHEKKHEQIMIIANKLISSSDSDFDKVKKIYDYLIAHTEYRYSEDGIYSQTIFKKYYMDCVGYAEFMNIALNSVGVECFSVQDNTHGHVWNIVKVDDKYYHLDATYSDTSSWNNTSQYRYFLVSDDFMLADHRFFVSEKDVECNDVYNLSGIVSDNNVAYRGYIGEQINLISDNHKIGEYEDSGYNLCYYFK